jgi:hypothetical protein
MRFAVLQKTFEPVSLEQLGVAFAKIPGLTAMDAAVQCEGAFGILVRNFTGEQASALQAGLRMQGVETEIVPENALPVLPIAKQIRRAEIRPECFSIQDQLLMKSSIAWNRIAFIAAGWIQQSAFVRKRTEWEEVRTEMIHLGGMMMIPIQHTETKFEYASRESSAWVLRADLVIAGEPFTRVSIEENRFDFFAEGKRTTDNLPYHFHVLLRGIMKHCPNAVLSRGAIALGGDEPKLFDYPKKSAFENELTWLMWKAAQKSA